MDHSSDLIIKISIHSVEPFPQPEKVSHPISLLFLMFFSVLEKKVGGDNNAMSFLLPIFNTKMRKSEF